MRKVLLVLGILILAFSVLSMGLLLLNLSNELNDIRYTQQQNIAKVLALAAVDLGIFYLGFRLFRAGRKAVPMRHSAPSPKAVKSAAAVPPPVKEASREPAPKQASPAREAAPKRVSPAQTLPTETLDDLSYIRELHHSTAGPWHQYDILLDAGGYGWGTMLNWADAICATDLRMETVTVGDMGAGEQEYIGQVRQHGSLQATPELAEERGMLGVGGFSKTLPSPVKLVWFNQTRVLRIFSLLDDEALMTRYAETVIRRSFGTPDAMKLAKPHEKPDKGPAAGDARRKE